MIGRPLYVPYASPGIDLGKVFHQRLVEYVDRHGDLPQLVTLGNHGIVAIAPTPEGVDAISDMAVKAAQVRTAAYSIGGIMPLSNESVDKFFARDDITERRGNIAKGHL